MRGRRVEKNQQAFRDANERLEEAVADAVPDGSPVPFLCECADRECLGRVELSLFEYGDVRAVRDRFLLIPGHPLAEGEEIVEEHDRYQVTQK